jgi:hypothetical protein
MCAVRSRALWVAVDAYDANRRYDCFVNRIYGTAGADSWQICAEPGNAAIYFGSVEIDIAALPATWTHVAFVVDQGLVVAYVDGMPSLVHGAAPPAFDPAIGIWLGADAEPDPEVFLTGRLDELYIYDRALSAAEVAALAM